MDFFRRVINKISAHFLLRNIVLAVCGIIVFVYLVSVALNLFTRHGQRYSVPELLGKTVEEVAPLIEDADLELVVIDSLFVPGVAPGTIIDQSPEPTSSVKSGRKVFLVINSISPRSEVIPYVTGYSLRQAKNILEGKGFEIKRLVYKPDMANNNVIGESYNGKEIVRGSTLKATLGEGITLIVGRSGGAPLPIVPKVIGLTLREAKSRLWEIGLNVGEVRRDVEVTEMNIDEARVYKQSPGQQSRYDYGSSVMLYLTTKADKINDGSRKSDSEARKMPSEAADDISAEELEKLLAE